MTDEPKQVKPVEPTTPTEPTTPIEPITPVEPTKPVESITPVDTPIEPPVEPAKPTTPIEPITPDPFDMDSYMDNIKKDIEADNKAKEARLKIDMDNKIDNQKILDNPRLKDLIKGMVKDNQASESKLRAEMDVLRKALAGTSAGSKAPDLTAEDNPFEVPQSTKTPATTKSGLPTIETIKRNFGRDYLYE